MVLFKLSYQQLTYLKKASILNSEQKFQNTQTAVQIIIKNKFFTKDPTPTENQPPPPPLSVKNQE